MLGTLRRLRLLTWMLLLSTPGLAGTVLQAAHPCPVDAPWLAAEQAGHHGGHAGHHGSVPDDAGQDAGHGVCNCVGACQVGAPAPLPSGAGPIRVVPVAVVSAPVVPSTTTAPVWRPLDRLPPSTAPPTA